MENFQYCASYIDELDRSQKYINCYLYAPSFGFRRADLLLRTTEKMKCDVRSRKKDIWKIVDYESLRIVPSKREMKRSLV